MIELFKEINQMFWNGSPFQWFFYASVFLIIVLERRRTYRLLFGFFPIVMVLCVFNPLTAKVVGVLIRGSRLYYVRLFSVFPIFYCMAHMGTLLLKRAKGGIKLVGVCAAVAVIMLAGHNVYRETWMQRAENLQKTPEEVFQVLDVIPREKENMRVAFPNPLYLYARQVDGNILMPFGRELGGLPNPLREELDKSNPDVMALMTLAGKEAVDYIVVNRSDDLEADFHENGYEPVGETLDYLVYKVAGVNLRELALNNKRQIVSNTAYQSRYLYEYDRWGNTVKETYCDESGKRMTTQDGYASVLRRYKLEGLIWVVDSVKYTDASDEPVQVSGRAETRFDYNWRKELIGERYYDFNGLPINRTDVGYAAVSRQYDSNSKVISEAYRDTSGMPVNCVEGYASITRQYDNAGRTTVERYYDAKGAVTNNAAGFAEWNRTYNDSGTVIEERFFDENGKEIKIRELVMDNDKANLLQWLRHESVANSSGISYQWDSEGNCVVSGVSGGISWNNLLQGERPFYLFNGETYRIQYSGEKVYLCVSFYKDSNWTNQIGPTIITLSDEEFTVPKDCGAVIIRLWIAPGTEVNERVHPCIFAQKTS